MITIYESESDIKEDKPLEAGIEEVQPILQEAKEKPKDDPDGLSSYIKNFLSEYSKKLSETESKGETVIQVSEVLGGIARLYERIRTAVEYKGEHVLRRNAIERILKRLVWEEESVRSDVDGHRVATALMKELIWAGYLPNGEIPRSKTDELRVVLEKYIYFLRNLDTLPKSISAVKVRSWMWGVASSEIEDLVDPSFRELYVKLMYEWFTDHYEWVDKGELDEHTKEVQIYLSIHRAFPKSDESIMRYHLLLKEFPNWKVAGKSEINRFILLFPKIYSEIEAHLDFPGRFDLYRKVQKHSAAFEIFKDISKETKFNLEALLKDRQKFEEKVRDICEQKYKLITQRVSTGIIRSIIYIFLTKVVFAMLIEIPYEVIFKGDVRYVPLAINMLLPPSMMWLIGLSIRVPGAKNTESIISRLTGVIYIRKESIKQNFSLAKRGNTPLTSIFGILYFILFILVFGGIAYGLTFLNFTLFGILIFFMFLSLVMLFAYRVRYNASQLKIDSDREDIFGHLTSYITLPFLNFGFYLSRGLAKLNFFTVLLDFLIEIPLKNIIEVFEEWTSFLRQKKEEVVEIPE